MKINNNIKTSAILLVLFAIWGFVFRDFFTGRISVFTDSLSYVHWNKYFFDNLGQGTYPFWQPFNYWGRPVGYLMRFIGDYNPFLLMTFFFYRVLGLPFGPVYFSYSYLYYFLGIWGFYLLIRRLYRDPWLALTGAALLLFSSAGINIFYNYCEIVLLVPLIWFFYFLTAFARDFSVSKFSGMIFSLMILFITYMPFYFLVVLGVFLLFFCALYFSLARDILKKTWVFIKTHKIFTVLCLFALGISLWPGLSWYLDAGHGEFVYRFRQADSGLTHGAAVGLRGINPGGVIGPVSFHRLFSGLSRRLNEISYFFIPLSAYLMVLLSFGGKLNKKTVLFSAVPFLMLLISLTDATPVHQFLYEHVFVFKFMRNIYYLLHLSLPFLVLFLVEQIRQLLAYQTQVRRHKAWTSIWIFIVHAGFAVFLSVMGDILWSSYATIVLSAGLCWLYVWRENKGGLFRQIFFAGILLTVMIQPLEMFSHYLRNAKLQSHPRSYDVKPDKVKFFFTRLKKNESRGGHVFQDQNGFVKRKYAGVKNAQILLDHIERAVLEPYVLNKFVVYDRVAPMNNADIDWKNLRNAFLEKRNTAYVYAPDLREEVVLNPGAPARYRAVTGPGKGVEVLEFSLNHIRFKTRFPKEKFLVYNDNFHSRWQARINGKPARIYLANVAFKGFFLDKGENIVDLSFGGFWQRHIPFGIMGIFLVFFVIVLKGNCFSQQKGMKTDV